jgi:hypothetical protein
MTVPWQLRVRRKRRHRPLIEQLPHIDARVWSRRKLFPPNWADKAEYDFGLIVPAISIITLSRSTAEITLRNGAQQAIPIWWQKTGYGQRPLFVCPCGRRAFRLYTRFGRFGCYRCIGAIYLSQAVDSKARAAVQASRLRHYLGHWGEKKEKIPPKPSGMATVTYYRLIGRLSALEARCPNQWGSRRVRDDSALLMPLMGYATQSANRLGA